MNIAQRRILPALLAFVGLLASLVSSGAAAVPLFSRRAAQLIVPIAGTLAGETEDIALKGRARINSTTFSDPDLGGEPGVVLLIDLIAVIGVGLQSRTRYFAHGENRVVRALRSTDLVELTFPITPVNVSAIKTAMPVLASFQLSFDVDQGQLLAASASFSSPSF
ncbi:hypothetical protein D3880_06500 [Pseudomonas cavernae]|uniref:Uncharacterized protein n=1 Tax=Pseudomonas cavernae TaxID=2320867 RepID=A0A385Z3A1_9PSED|nr:hypothetical protein [Pseudomonas cavernae]AYC32052.1 hypothetical protein D3880_06500 [Pseudomonas cavernae]